MIDKKKINKMIFWQPPVIICEFSILVTCWKLVMFSFFFSLLLLLHFIIFHSFVSRLYLDVDDQDGSFFPFKFILFFVFDKGYKKNPTQKSDSRFKLNICFIFNCYCVNRRRKKKVLDLKELISLNKTKMMI